jgi:hypothetical protein
VSDVLWVDSMLSILTKYTPKGTARTLSGIEEGLRAWIRIQRARLSWDAFLAGARWGRNFYMAEYFTGSENAQRVHGCAFDAHAVWKRGWDERHSVENDGKVYIPETKDE